MMTWPIWVGIAVVAIVIGAAFGLLDMPPPGWAQQPPRRQGEFHECDTCAAKPGMPVLCAGCLHNRRVIEGWTSDQRR